MVVWSVGGPLILAIGASTLGWLLVRAAGATNEVAVAAAVPCAVVLVTLFGLLQIVVAVPFSWWSVALLGALLALAARLVRRRTRRSTRSSPEPTGRGGARVPSAYPVLSLAGSYALACVVVWMAGGGRWDTASQTWDAIFDTNAVRHATLTGIVAPTRISDFAYPTPLGNYYPSGFHALAVLAMDTGGTAVAASNVTAALIAGALWPSCVILAAWYTFGRSTSVLLGSMVAAWGLWGMPWSPLGWGVLWATSVAAAFAPLAFAGLAGALGFTRQPRGRAGAFVLLIGALVVIAVCHPRVFVLVGLILFLTWQGVQGYAVLARWRDGRRLAAATHALKIILSGGLLLAVALFVGRDSSQFAARAWPVERTVVAEVVGYLVNGAGGSFPQLIGAFLILGGVIAAWRRPRMLWLVVLGAIAVLLDVLTATLVGNKPFNGLARFWYNDRHRTAPVAAGILVLLAVLGFDSWWRTVQRRTWGALAQARRRRLASAVVVLALGWGAGVGLTHLRAFYADAANDPVASLVDAGDREFYRRVADIVPPDDRVLNNAKDGSGFLYAYEGVQLVFYLASQTASTDHGVALRDRFTTLNSQELCRVLKADSVDWVLNGGRAYEANGIERDDAPGMQIPDGFWATSLVLQEGDRKLFKVTGCG